jgi:hypothetical protein
MAFAPFMKALNVRFFKHCKGWWSYQVSFRFWPYSFSMIMLWNTTHAINTYPITSLFHYLQGFVVTWNLTWRIPNNIWHLSMHSFDILQNVGIFLFVVHGSFEQRLTTLDKSHEQLNRNIHKLSHSLWSWHHSLDLPRNLQPKGIGQTHPNRCYMDKQPKINMLYSQQFINNYF